MWKGGGVGDGEEIVEEIKKYKLRGIRTRSEEEKREEGKKKRKSK